MKKLFIVFCLSFLGCNNGISSLEQTSVLYAPAPSPVIETLNNSKVEVRHLDLTQANVTFLTSEVNGQSVTQVISDIQRFNEKGNAPTYLILDSPGGSVIDGAKLISVMQTSKNPIYAIDTGLAASMAFVILEHANKRLATPRSILMAHPASFSSMVNGELDKTVSFLSFLKRFVDKMDYYIAARAGMSYDEFKLKSNKSLWIDSNDALDQHLLDELVSVKLPVQTMFGMGTDNLKRDFKLE